jgi:hypothetical protein
MVRDGGGSCGHDAAVWKALEFALRQQRSGKGIKESGHSRVAQEQRLEGLLLASLAASVVYRAVH